MPSSWRALWLLLVSLAASACSPYLGSARDVAPETVRRERGWLVVEDVPVVRQRSEHDCGAAALAMVVRHFEPAAAASDPFFTQPADRRISAQDLRDHARALGFDAFVVEGWPDDLVRELKQGRPAIVGVAKPTVEGAVAHYQVVVGIHPESKRIAVIDPAEGWRQNTYEGFVREWQASGRVLLVVIPRAHGAASARSPGGTSSACASGCTGSPRRIDQVRVNAAPKKNT
jgi:predicted double-glycine peptidase